MYPHKPGIVELDYSPLVDCLHKAGDWAEANYTIESTDFASHYCIGRGNSLKMDTQLVGFPI